MAAPFLLAPDEEFIQCPYEPSHRITNLRFLVHLCKCRRNYEKTCKEMGKKIEMIPCRFNYLHQVHKPELDYHHRNCQDQYQVVKHIQYHASDEFKKVKEEATTAEQEKQPKAETSSSLDNGYEEEDWDKDCSVGYQAGYDPKEKLKNEAILYNPSGLTKSERKAHRQENRKKFAEMDSKRPKTEYKVEANSFN